MYKRVIKPQRITYASSPAVNLIETSTAANENATHDHLVIPTRISMKLRLLNPKHFRISLLCSRPQHVQGSISDTNFQTIVVRITDLSYLGKFPVAHARPTEKQSNSVNKGAHRMSTLPTNYKTQHEIRVYSTPLLSLNITVLYKRFNNVGDS